MSCLTNPQTVTKSDEMLSVGQLTCACFLSVFFLFCHIYIFIHVPSLTVSVHVCLCCLRHVPPFGQFCSYSTSLRCSSFSFSSFILISAVARHCNLGGVSSRQPYPTAQYESGLQQRGQQGEQPGHQPRTLLHTAW